MTRDFHARFKIQINLNEARQRFVNRAQNLIFRDLLDRCQSIEEAICNEVATTLGDVYVYQANPSRYIQGDFNRTLLAIEGFYRATSPFGTRFEIDSRVQRLINESEVNLSIRWQEGRFYPEGAPLLDEKLVNDVLGWLQDPGLRAVLEPFQKGIRHLLDSAQRADLRADVITDMYETLEALAKIVTDHPDRDLSANRELFIRQVKASESYKQLMKQYIEYANDFRHAAIAAKPRPTISPREAESFVYLTGVFLRLAMPSHDA